MPHASNIVYCDGPDSPHAFDIVPLQPRNGSLDAMCPVCKGHDPEVSTLLGLVFCRHRHDAVYNLLGYGVRHFEAKLT
jgi:hypothetical protein